MTMEELIYKFLDDYVGEGVVCKSPPNLRGLVVNNIIHRAHALHSWNGVLIFEVIVSEDKDHYKFLYNNDLSKTISGFFGVDEPFNYVRNWFGKKYNMEKVSDISKFLDE